MSYMSAIFLRDADSDTPIERNRNEECTCDVMLYSDNLAHSKHRDQIRQRQQGANFCPPMRKVKKSTKQQL